MKRKLLKSDFKKIKEYANLMRREIIIHTSKVGFGHLGGSLSCCEILALLYYIRSKSDEIIFSKAHTAPALYAALKVFKIAKYKNPLYEYGGRPGPNTPINFPVNILGVGLGIGLGCALGKKFKGNSGEVFIIIGDGECSCGTVWESAMIASKLELDNLTVIVDRNMFSEGGRIDDLVSLEPFAEKWKSFGWVCASVNGHNVKQLFRALKKKSSTPKAIIANTIKGFGVSFIEGSNKYHHQCLHDKKLIKKALAELEDKK